jgi:hypothetical protein
MGWIADLFKHITVSRSLVGACFITSFILLFGENFAPALINPAPPQWKWILLVVLIFSFALQVIWYIPKLCRLIFDVAKPSPAKPATVKLEPDEIRMLKFLSQFADNSINLDKIAKVGRGVSKLELLDVSERLQAKGLVESSPYDNGLINLSPEGRKRCLQMAKDGLLV